MDPALRGTGSRERLVRLDTYELIRRGERELEVGDPAARETFEQARRALLERGDADGLQQLLPLVRRLEEPRRLTSMIEQNLEFLARERRAPVRKSRLA